MKMIWTPNYSYFIINDRTKVTLEMKANEIDNIRFFT